MPSGTVQSKQLSHNRLFTCVTGEIIYQKVILLNIWLADTFLQLIYDGQDTETWQ